MAGMTAFYNPVHLAMIFVKVCVKLQCFSPAKFVVCYILLTSQTFQERQRHGIVNTDLFLADINAYRSNFSEAARLYKKSGNSQKAVDMYTDLRMFDLAKVSFALLRKLDVSHSGYAALIASYGQDCLSDFIGKDQYLSWHIV